MNIMSEITLKKTRVVEQHFTAHHTQPDNGRGFINFSFDDNRDDCLCAPSDMVCWKASLTMKAFSSMSDQPDPQNDLLLMEANIALESDFAVGELDPKDSLVSVAWYFDENCKQQLLGKLRLLLLDTEFSRIPLPGNR